MRGLSRLVWSLSALPLLLMTGPARGDFLLTFEGLKQGEEVLEFYDGGTGSKGSMGPDYGVEFTPFAVALTKGNYVNPPTPPTICFLGADPDKYPSGSYPLSFTMNVEGGLIDQLIFHYAALDHDGFVGVYSGFDGTGTLLATKNLPITDNHTGVFVGPETLPFDGVAHSVVWTGANQQLAIDDVQFTPFSAVAEPTTIILAMLGTLFAPLAARK